MALFGNLFRLGDLAIAVAAALVRLRPACSATQFEAENGESRRLQRLMHLPLKHRLKWLCRPAQSHPRPQISV
jgi:hypothetical protein